MRRWYVVNRRQELRVDSLVTLFYKRALVTTPCLPNRGASRSRHPDDVISGLAGVLNELFLMAMRRHTSRRSCGTGIVGVSRTNQCCGYCASTNGSSYKSNPGGGLYHKHVTETGCSVHCGPPDPLVLVSWSVRNKSSHYSFLYKKKEFQRWKRTGCRIRRMQ